MTDTLTTYGDISPRTAAKTVKGTLKRHLPYLITDRFAQFKPLEKRSGKTMIWRRYLSLSTATTPLMEGVTPSGQKPTYEDIQGSIYQLGDFLELTDVIEDTHEDPVLNEFMDLCMEQARESKEIRNIMMLKAGTNVYYANGSARTDVNTFTSAGQLRKIVRALMNNKAKRYTKILAANPNYNTTPVASSFWAMCDTDCVADLKALTGFTQVKDYPDPSKAIEGEIGACEEIRFVATTLFDAWADGGGAVGTNISTASVASDVYPIIIIARDAYAVIPLRGKSAYHPYVLNPNKPRGGDPLGQRGSVGWKIWHGGAILNETFLMRVEVACTLNPSVS